MPGEPKFGHAHDAVPAPRAPEDILPGPGSDRPHAVGPKATNKSSRYLNGVPAA